MSNRALGQILSHYAPDRLLGKKRFDAVVDAMSRTDFEPTDFPCPSCMIETLVSDEYEGVTLDWCRTCHGIFLDRNEIETLIAKRRSAAGYRPSIQKQPDPWVDPDENLLSFLLDFFD